MIRNDWVYQADPQRLFTIGAADVGSGLPFFAIDLLGSQVRHKVAIYSDGGQPSSILANLAFAEMRTRDGQFVNLSDLHGTGAAPLSIFDKGIFGGFADALLSGLAYEFETAAARLNGTITIPGGGTAGMVVGDSLIVAAEVQRPPTMCLSDWLALSPKLMIQTKVPARQLVLNE